MAQLPQRLTLEQTQNQWASILNPVIASPIVNGRQINGVSLTNGTTVVDHKLGRPLQGWIIVGISGAATVYDNQATNQLKDLTLSLTSNAAVTANLWVY